MIDDDIDDVNHFFLMMYIYTFFGHVCFCVERVDVLFFIYVLLVVDHFEIETKKMSQSFRFREIQVWQVRSF